MVNAGRIAMAWITVLIVIIATLLLFTVLSPQVEIWREVVASALTTYGSFLTYDSALVLTWFGFKAFPLIVCGSIIVWAVFTSFSEEFQSDLGDL